MAKFNPNQHSKLPLEVWIKRMDKIFEVREAKLLDGYPNYIWGFAGTPDQIFEFDTTWGDIVGIDLKRKLKK